MNRSKHKRVDKGFALVATLLMMVLLAVVSVGLLSLSTISIRTSTVDQARRTAETNARLAVMLALGDLQKTLGDDRRVTASASIRNTGNQIVPNDNMVGVWKSNAPNSVSQGSLAPSSLTANFKVTYDKTNNNAFRGWLVSGDPAATIQPNFASGVGVGNLNTQLFKTVNDGFDLYAPKVVVNKTGSITNSLAWATIQEGDKANISQPGDTYVELNDAIHAPKHPNISHSGYATQPDNEWDDRASKLISLNQALLDPGYAISSSTKDPRAKLSRDYTVYSKGVMADVVNGGLKTDLNLAFEQSSGSFAKATWDGFQNPFRKTGSNTEVPIHPNHISTSPITSVYDYAINAASPQTTTGVYFTGSAASYDMLRSAYSSYRHLYLSNNTPTAYFRPQANRNWKNGQYPQYPVPRGSETSISPVLDRMIYFFSLKTEPTGEPKLLITPVITLWNPYNVAIEAKGYVAYPWMDMPLHLTWTLTKAANSEVKGAYMSQYIGQGIPDAEAGRQLAPYFFCELTGNGLANSTPVRLLPGEIRAFIPASTTPVDYIPTSTDLVKDRLVRMKPVNSAADMVMKGGLALDPRRSLKDGKITQKLNSGESFSLRLSFEPGIYRYYTTLEDSRRIGTNYRWENRGTVITEVQLWEGSATKTFTSPNYIHFPTAVPRIAGALTTFHRNSSPTTVNGVAVPQSDIVHTVNTRQRYVNAALTGSVSNYFLSGPHYSSEMRDGTSVASNGLELDGGQAYYGESNSASGGGRLNVILFDLPRQAPISLASFQHADLSDTAFSSSNQFGNSWASPYLAREAVFRVAKTASVNLNPQPQLSSGVGMGFFDYSWLLNEAMWDRLFMSSVAPLVAQKSGTGSDASYDNTMVTETNSVKDMITNWIDNPITHPLRNSHMTLHLGGLSKQQVRDKLVDNSGAIKDSAPLRIAEHILVEGAFNVNSTNVESWIAILSSLKGEDFNILQVNGNESTRNGDKSIPFPRISLPSGDKNDLWNGYRELDDAQIRRLAEEIVVEVKARGPFQSLAEFVNRRLESGTLGQKGALQAAIDRSGLNNSAKGAKFDTSKFFNPGNLPDDDRYTATGLPGWLTQADVLTPLASIITVRSDTFKIRGYAEVKDAAGAIIASATCEAVVQRVPEWVDPSDEPMVKPASLTSEINKFFGRRFQMVSFRMVPNKELAS